MRQTPLFSEYDACGAKVVDFHGWALPVQFSGILQEHQHTRTKAGLFDCSHMGEFVLTGADAIEGLDRLVYSDMVSLKPGRCRYTAILNDQAGIVDDCVGLRLDEDMLYLVTNAGPLEEVSAMLAQACGAGVKDVSAETAKIDIQGPLSRDVLLACGMEGVADLKYWTGTQLVWEGIEMVVTRAGYTGELGYELFMNAASAPSVWRRLVAQEEVAPCGLGARDTLRTEMGYPLNGEDMTGEVTPLEAGMGRFVAWDSDFPGKERLVAQRDSGDYKVLVGVRSKDRRAPRHGFEVRLNDVVVGEVTSGTFGSSVGCGVGLARVSEEAASEGTLLAAGPRGMVLEVAALPLYEKGTCRIKF